MSTPQDGPTAEQPQVTPTVSTVPARSRWSKLPAHLGRARTSTVILGLLFLAIGTLYLNIRPEPTNPATAGTSDEAPAGTTTPATRTTAEPTTDAPETTSEVPTITEDAPATTSTEPTDTATTPGEPTETSVPTGTPPTDPGTVPTTSVSPPG
jgi:cytoskeletal protein RodZ